MARPLPALLLTILNFESALTVLGIVEAEDFLFLRNPQPAGEHLGQVGHDKGARGREGRRADNGKKLYSQLPRIAVKEPPGAFADGRVGE